MSGEQLGGAVAHDTDDVWRGLVLGFGVSTAMWVGILLLFL